MCLLKVKFVCIQEFFFRCCYKNKTEIYIHIIIEIIDNDLCMIEILGLKSTCKCNLMKLIKALKQDKGMKKHKINALFVNYIKNQNKKMLNKNLNNIQTKHRMMKP